MQAQPAASTTITPRPVLNQLARSWWLVLLRGIAGIVFGVLALAWPGITLLMLVLFYGAYALVDGVFSLIAAFAGKGEGAPTWWLILVGILGIVAGLVTFFLPGISAVVLILVIGAWAVVCGIFEIIGAIQLRKEIDNEWLLILSGIVSVLFGLGVLIFPGAGALALIWLIATFAIAFGILWIVLAFRLRKHNVATA
jgi:uncharacterized membrane protein HdeD (DUF308 family)